MDLTQQSVRQILHYNPKTGIFVRLKSKQPKWIGRPTGYPAGVNKYWVVSINDKLYSYHRLVWLYMTGEWPKVEIDHIDRDKANNRWSNLREATSSQNKANRATKIDTKLSVARGVYKRHHRYEASIRCKRKRIYLGLFKTVEEANAAYNEAARKLHGEFASS